MGVGVMRVTGTVSLETELSSRTLERILYETVDLWNGERCLLLLLKFHVYYETIKRELNTRLINECRCDERLKGKGEGSCTSRIHWFVCIISGKSRATENIYKWVSV